MTRGGVVLEAVLGLDQLGLIASFNGVCYDFFEEK